jgi:holo-[acyl-carrier protein] synthase
VTRHVGIDLVSPADVRAAIDAHGERYLSRVFTAAERADCTRATGLDAALLAARVAAKEATFKALRIDDRAIAWTNVEVRRSGHDGPELWLSGPAATLASEHGVSELSLAFTCAHAGAAAVVVTTEKTDRPSTGV